jgi:hypothetical protein
LIKKYLYLLFKSFWKDMPVSACSEFKYYESRVKKIIQ